MKRLNKIVLGGLLVGTILTSGFASFATKDNRDDNLNSRRVEITEEQKMERVNSLKERITEKFENGFITEEHYNTVLLDIEEGRKPMFLGQVRGKGQRNGRNRSNSGYCLRDESINNK